MARKVVAATRLRGFDAPTVWSEFTPLSNKYKSVNLGQGFPDWEAPLFAKEALAAAVHSNFNQYCRTEGDMKLATTLANYYGKLIGRSINPVTEVAISVGATEGIFGIMQAFLNEGDEVIVLAPAFDM